MNSKETGGPAFPTGTFEHDGQNNVLQYQQGGMTLRDYFAGCVVSGLLSRGEFSSLGKIAELAYLVADEMLAERVKE